MSDLSAPIDDNSCRFCGQWNPPLSGRALRRCRFCNNRYDSDEDQTAGAVGPQPMSRASIPIAKPIAVPGSPAARSARPSASINSARPSGGLTVPLLPAAIILGALLLLALLARKMGWF